jgi:hypothetical protein
MPQVVLLGPQRLKPMLAGAIREARVEGPVAAVTAGWEEREEEIDELSEHLRRPVHNLRLFRRAEEVFRRDAELWLAFGDLLERREELRAAYRARLAHALDAVGDVLRATSDPGLREEEAAAAIEAVRGLDERHAQRVAALRAEFEATARPGERDDVVRHRQEVARVLEDSSMLAVAGGHVQVLLDRLRLFDVTASLGQRPVFAWSGGAMVVAERVVLFHDRPPQGAGHAEVLDAGLGLAKGVLPLPHARRRLDLADRTRVAGFARRFAPLRCLALDEECALTVGPRGGVAVARARELLPSGDVAQAGTA